MSSITVNNDIENITHNISIGNIYFFLGIDSLFRGSDSQTVREGLTMRLVLELRVWSGFLTKSEPRIPGEIPQNFANPNLGHGPNDPTLFVRRTHTASQHNRPSEYFNKLQHIA